MTAGWHVRVMRAALIPCPLVLVLAACTPTVKGASVQRGPDASADSALHVRLDALTQELSRAQQNNSALQTQLNERGQEVQQLRAEVQDLRARATDTPGVSVPGGAEASHDEAASPAPVPSPGGADADGATSQFAAAEAASRDDSDSADKVSPGVLVASLRQALSEERQRRQSAETQLERLKEETSRPPYGEEPATLPYGNESPLSVDFAAAKQEIVELRHVLDDERAQRARLTNDLIALQLRVEREGSSGGDHAGDAPELQERLHKLEAERQAAVDALNRNLAASQQRTADLEAELAAARAADAGTDPSAAAVDSEMASIHAENAKLRARLEDEHRRTEELASKLKLATRVTDLIFKMQAQQVGPPPAR
jgi:chromosome segregation ATPase